MTRLASTLALFLAACAPDAPERPTVSTPTDTLLPVNGTRLFVHREGEGTADAPPLVVIHGGPLLDQTYLRGPLAPLADGRELVFYDQRLSGRSEGTVDSASVRLATLVDDLEAIRTTLDLGPVDLLAHSWGGLIAVAYAIEHPEAVRRLVLVSPMAPSARLRQQEETAQRAALEPADTAGTGELRADPGVAAGEPAAFEALLVHSFRWQLHDPALAAELDFHIPDDYGERSLQFSRIGRDLTDYDFTDRLGRITAPTLLVYGDAEVGAPIGGEALGTGIPDVTTLVLEDTGHFAFLESPQRFLAEVRRFLGG